MSPLGTCPNCGHMVRLTVAGTLARHLQDGVADSKARHRRWLCPGSGRWPTQPHKATQPPGGSA